MADSVIFNSPLLILGFAAALALCLFSLAKKAGFAATLFSVLIFIFTAAYALLLGAPLEEVGLVAILFFCVNLLAAWRGRRNK